MVKHKKIVDSKTMGGPEIFEGSIEYVISFLQNFLEKLHNEYDSTTMIGVPKMYFSAGFDEYECGEFVVEFERDETDKERSKRLTKLKKKREEKSVRLAAQDEAEKELYLKLKKKFEENV